MFYRRLLLTLIVLLIFKGVLFSQSTDSLIKSIQAKCQYIHTNLKTYDTILKEEWEGSSEGGEIIGYHKNKDIKIIKGVYFGETGKTETQYCFDDSELIFYFEKRYEYNRPIYWDKEHLQENSDSTIFDLSKTTITEERLYYHKEKLIRWIRNGKKEVDLSDYTNSLFGQSLITHAYKIRRTLKNN